MKQTLGFYHQGSVPNEKTKEALAFQGHRVMCRNADYFHPADVEDFDVVVAGEDVDAKALQAAYGDVPVKTVDAFVAEKPKSSGTEKKPEKPFDPDAEPAKREPKKQG